MYVAGTGTEIPFVYNKVIDNLIIFVGIYVQNTFQLQNPISHVKING